MAQDSGGRFHRKGNTDVDGLGVGLGGNFVFIPSGDSTKAAPALTIHFGTSGRQLFFGWLFTSTRSVDLPGGNQANVVPADFDVSTLIRPGGSRAPAFFAGIVIGGVAVTKP